MPENVFSVKQFAEAVGVSTRSALRMLEKRGVPCRAFGTRVVICGAVDDFVQRYAAVVRKALEELTRRCRTRCCTVPHGKILEHPEVAALIHSLGYGKVKTTPAAAMSIDILAQTGFQLYKDPSGRIVVRICRGAEQRDELFEAMCKLANGIGGAVTLAASKIAKAAGLKGHAYVLRAAAMLAELCQTLPCKKLKNRRYVFDRKALLEYCKKQTYTDRRLKRYESKYGRGKSTTVVAFRVPAEMLEGLQRLAEQWAPPVPQ
ncbi:MAG: hypothetical protein ABWU84_12285 [Pyrobaculum sp.]|uniref:hypothetical protein n=1 Tax=Pyrobaculum sp. TaxID=2004705 RepID=UPI003EEE46BF